VETLEEDVRREVDARGLELQRDGHTQRCRVHFEALHAAHGAQRDLVCDGRLQHNGSAACDCELERVRRGLERRELRNVPAGQPDKRGRPNDLHLDGQALHVLLDHALRLEREHHLHGRPVHRDARKQPQRFVSRCQLNKAPRHREHRRAGVVDQAGRVDGACELHGRWKSADRRQQLRERLAEVLPHAWVAVRFPDVLLARCELALKHDVPLRANRVCERDRDGRAEWEPFLSMREQRLERRQRWPDVHALHLPNARAALPLWRRHRCRRGGRGSAGGSGCDSAR
jgi:hypothetical protein